MLALSSRSRRLADVASKMEDICEKSGRDVIGCFYSATEQIQSAVVKETSWS
jgi:hypothetical protein